MSSTSFLHTLIENCPLCLPYAEKLSVIFKGSPYLLSIAEKNPSLVQTCFEKGFLKTADAHLEAFQTLSIESDDADFMKRMRLLKNHMALTLALGDLLGFINLKTLTRLLSKLADCAIHLALSKAYKSFSKKYNVTKTLEESGLFILGLGKLGSKELNYSSDIDLICFYAPNALGLDDETASFFNRMAKHFIHLLQELTIDGYVFRVDMRLRPDPLSTPIAISVEAAQKYYHDLGQNWERAAFIKARAIAGDMDEAKIFLEKMQPFIWREHLDYAAIDEIRLLRHQMLSRFETHDPNPGYNVKLGQGGIRDIEFFAQSNQLIWGGRHTELQTPSTLKALFELQKLNLISNNDCVNLENAYVFLRNVEHRLQMIHDAQTHALPQNQEALLNLAHFCFYQTTNDLLYDIQKHSSAVTRFLQKIAPPKPSALSLQHLLTPFALKDRGFKNIDAVIAKAQTWLNGDYTSTRSEQERASLERLLPTILETLKAFPNPDEGFFAIDTFLSGLSSGLSAFAFFEANPHVLQTFITLLAGKTILKDYLMLYPYLIDYFVYSESKHKIDAEKTLNRNLKKAAGLDATLSALTLFLREERFKLGLMIFEGHYTHISQKLTSLAEKTMRTLFDALLKDFGAMKADSFCILGLGSLGAQTMNHPSDLDLIFLYDDDKEDPALFSKFTKNMIAALTTQTAEGPLYPLDMQLRPSGNKGHIVNSFTSFEKYHLESAWVWEHFALTKTRVIAGSPRLKAKVEKLLQTIYAKGHDKSRTVQEIAYFKTQGAHKQTKSIKDFFKWKTGGFYELSSIRGYLKLVPTPLSQETLQKLNLTHIFYTNLKVMLGLIPSNYEGTLENLLTDFPFSKHILNPETFEKTCAYVHSLYQELIENPAQKLPPMDYGQE